MPRQAPAVSATLVPPLCRRGSAPTTGPALAQRTAMPLRSGQQKPRLAHPSCRRAGARSESDWGALLAAPEARACCTAWLSAVSQTGGGVSACARPNCAPASAWRGNEARPSGCAPWAPAALRWRLRGANCLGETLESARRRHGPSESPENRAPRLMPPCKCLCADACRGALTFRRPPAVGAAFIAPRTETSRHLPHSHLPPPAQPRLARQRRR